MITITLYYKKNDDPDGKIRNHLEDLGKELGFSLVDICLDENPDLSDRLQEETSALQIGPFRLRFPFSDTDILIAVKSYQDRQQRLQPVDDYHETAVSKVVKISMAERFSYWLSNNYVWFITLILVIYTGLPIVAPFLMKNKLQTPAQIIYKVYSVLCHQLSFRSFFIYGEQSYYPRQLAHIPNVLSYEQVTSKSALDIDFARSFEGNELLGYKVALCERDIAIYGSLILAGLLFQLTGRKLKALTWYFWILLAILPIGLDGGTQLFSLGGNWPAWFPIRESTPLLRTITGSLFGLATGWYIYPMMEENMKDIRVGLARKIAIKKKMITKEKAL
ncbi:MAG: DUF2085 domain-containing protein [Anaerolineaceae bacterium]